MRSAHAPRFSTRRPNSGKAKVVAATVAGRFLWKVYNPGLPAKLSTLLLLLTQMFIFVPPPTSAPLELFFLFFLLVILLLLLGSWACAMALEEAGEAG